MESFLLAQNRNGNEQRLIKAIIFPKITKYIYKYLIEKKVEQPNVIQKWYGIDNEVYDWDRIFTLSYLTARNTKIHYFQFCFVHRIRSTNLFHLRKMGKCKGLLLWTFCRNENETLRHLFWECCFVETFWVQSCNLCLKSNFDQNYNLVKFGHFHEARHFFIPHAK